MKYHKYEIIKIRDGSLGDDYGRENQFYYRIMKDGKFVANALTLSNAKEFIDCGEDWNVLC